MFDELDNNQSKPDSAKPSDPAPVGLSSALKARLGGNAQGAAGLTTGMKPEDIFAEVDKSAKPEVFIPRPDKAAPRGTVIPPETGWKSNKKMVFSLLFGGLIVVVAGGYLGLKLAVKGNQEVNNTATGGRTVNTEPAKAQPNLEPAAVMDVNNPAVNNMVVEPIPPAVMMPLDSDYDGLTDDDEAGLGTDANIPDTDGDGLTDREEVNTYKTDPLKADTDGDGYKDGDEVINGYNPSGPGKLLEIKN